MQPYYQDSHCTLYHGDCREVLPMLGHVDVVVTDPPYGVEFSGIQTKTRKHTQASYEDTADAWKENVLPRVHMLLQRVSRMALFCGTRKLQEYPPASDIGGIVCPNGAGIGRWGFNCFHPVLFYGKPPRNQKEPSWRVLNHPGMHVTKEYNGHPCPKPLEFMRWLVRLSTNPREICLDPFMGSATTGVACLQLGRRFIGIEIEERYCAIAARRLAATVDNEEAASCPS